jgi:hypothetical protein
VLGKRKTKTGNTFLGFLDTISDCSERDLDDTPTLALLDSTKQPYLVKRTKLTEKIEIDAN